MTKLTPFQIIIAKRNAAIMQMATLSILVVICCAVGVFALIKQEATDRENAKTNQELSVKW